MNIPLPEKPKRTLRAALLSPFSQTHRLQREILRLDPALAIIMRSSISTPDGRFLYLKNAKAGCQTISQFLYVLHDYLSGRAVETDRPEQARGFPDGIRHWRFHQSVLDNPAALRFTFVRHPVNRIKSAFFNFFVDERNTTRYRHWNNMLSLGFKPGGDIGYNFEVFLEYVGMNFDQDEFYCDQHWRKQWIGTGSGKVKYDFIGKLENFDADLATFLGMAGAAPLAEARIKPKVFNRSSHGANDELGLSPAQLRKVRDLYEIDFAAYGYN